MAEPASKMDPNAAAHMAIWMPYALQHIRALEKNQTRLVHYTSAHVGLEILRTRTMWMRLTSCMTDTAKCSMV
jgi:hypothetical protein